MSRSRSSSATTSPPLDLHRNRSKGKTREDSRRKRRYSSGSSKSGGANHRTRSHSRSRDPKRSKSKSKLRSPRRKQRRSRSQNSRSRSGSSRRGRDLDYQVTMYKTGNDNMDRHSNEGKGKGKTRDCEKNLTKWSFDDHNSEDGYRLHVADLDSNAVKRDLEKLFGKYGPMKEIWMSQGFAFVVYEYREDAEEAQHKTDGAEVCGRQVRVTVARPRTNVMKRNLRNMSRSRSRSASRKAQGDSRRKRCHSIGSSRSRGADQRSRSHSRSGDRKMSKSRSPRHEQRRSQSRDSRSRSGSTRQDFRGWSFNDHNSEDGYRLHVADLDSSADKRDLEKLFGRYGTLKEIWMAQFFAFVVFRYREDAEEAQQKANGLEVCGRRIRVTVARPRTALKVGGNTHGCDPNMICYQCGERGHFSRNCPDQPESKWGYKRPPSPRSSRGSRDDPHLSRDCSDSRGYSSDRPDSKWGYKRPPSPRSSRESLDDSHRSRF